MEALARQLTIRKAAVILEARHWLGTPWRHQASVKGVGCDCAGLVRGVGNALGLMDCREGSQQAAEFEGYGRLPEPRRMVKALNMFMDRKEIAYASEGDVLLMRFDSDPQHLAILTGDGTIVHALQRIGRVVEHRLSGDWRARIVGAWAYRV